MKALFLTLSSVLSCWAWAASSSGPIDCWDHTFSYTQTRVAPLEGNDDFYEITVQSQNETLFPDLISGPRTGWGEIKVSFLTNKRNCVSSPEREDVLKCLDQNPGTLDISYQDTEESEKILHLEATQVTYTTQVVGEKMILDMSYLANSKTNPQGSLHLEFRLGPGAPKCTGFQH